MLDINFQSFIDSDNSPFVLFDSSAKVLYLNSSAEILFGYVTPQEIYDLALQNAPLSFGYHTTNIKLKFDSFSFYAITVGYENDEQIYIRLYNTPRIKQQNKLDKSKLITTDINLLLEANLALFKTKNQAKIHLIADFDIPKFKLNQNQFSKLLRKILDSFLNAKEIEITLKFLVGEHIIIDNKRHSVIQLLIKSTHRDCSNDDDIYTLAQKSCCNVSLKENLASIEIPLMID
jgi:hypothetical protein